jgi:hypothetical protein
MTGLSCDGRLRRSLGAGFEALIPGLPTRNTQSRQHSLSLAVLNFVKSGSIGRNCRGLYLPPYKLRRISISSHSESISSNVSNTWEESGSMARIRFNLLLGSPPRFSKLSLFRSTLSQQIRGLASLLTFCRHCLERLQPKAQ